ncbi:MAG: Dabb family protein [Acidimicrobiales bacterium]|nr:Dabb family protein [Acidimicrobiales bacterium]MCB1014261.1 Dabb family protein [Acidimicrobiales bacterium]MCB9373334.1 Dabb family protein [Microthrixaceae bacterium]
MIRHVVLLRWTPQAGADQRQAVLDALRRLPAAIPEIDRYRLGTDLGLAEGNAGLSVIADFATVADYEVYRDHPEHQRVIAELIKPILAGRSALQYEVDPADA